MEDRRPARKSPSRPVRSAWDWALFWLSRKDYTAKELLQKWSRKEVPSEEAQATLKRLQDAGLQSDARCMELRVRQRALMGKGQRWVKQEFRSSGLDTSEQMDEQWELHREANHQKARGLINRKYPNWMNDRLTKQKAVQFLLRRGYNFDELRVIMTESQLRDCVEVFEE